MAPAGSPCFGNRGRCSMVFRNQSPWSAKSSRTSLGVTQRRVWLACSRTVAQSILRNAWRAAAARTGVMLNSRIPSPTNRQAKSASPASSPQTQTGRSLAAAASTTCLIAQSTAGCHGVHSSVKSAAPRSAANMYCVRSFVPIDNPTPNRRWIPICSASSARPILASSAFGGRAQLQMDPGLVLVRVAGLQGMRVTPFRAILRQPAHRYVRCCSTFPPVLVGRAGITAPWCR